MNTLAMTLALATVATLDLILLVGAGLPGSASGERLTAVVVPLMDLCLVVSSVLLARILIAVGVRKLGFLFVLNLALFAMAAVVRARGSMPPRWLLYGVDVYWVNLYLVTLARHWPVVSGRRVA
jgi:hypothetical protein